ncbi:hypothetical protein FRC02_008734 [Tulasnella sp. 418]|nr:hypothetical protein FRC02_008734 [Tulasnella sp. 418]
MVRRPKRKSVGKNVDYEEMSDEEYFHMLEDEEQALRLRRKEDEKDAHEMARQYAITKAFKMVNNLHLKNKVMQLRKVCSHPFLFYWPDDPKTGTSVINEQLINASGKMLLLNRLLGELFRRKHKVLLFSQFTTMLDVIQDWAEEFKGWECCRIDGSTSIESRKEQMDRFNNGGEGPDACRLFLLSTRAGGLGINLVAADSVIFYDQDWNPQMDLQAQDRAHRIGQTRPVLIFRLVSAHTVETHILERASQKRKLEALVIAKGKFKMPGGRAPTKNESGIAEMAASLLSLEGEKVDIVTSDDKIISDEDLDALLDRSPEVFTERKIGWSKQKAQVGAGGTTTRKTKAGAPSMAFKVFERSADEANDGLARMMDEDSD